MKNKAYYVLNPNDEEETDVDNPDQRITDDTRAFTGQSLSFTLGVFDAFLTFLHWLNPLNHLEQKGYETFQNPLNENTEWKKSVIQHG